MLIYALLGKQTNDLCFHTTCNMPATGTEALSKGLVLNIFFMSLFLEIWTGAEEPWLSAHVKRNQSSLELAHGVFSQSA